MKWIALIAALPTLASAQAFIEVGVGATLGGCIYHQKRDRIETLPAGNYAFHPGCSGSALGLFAVGYQFNDQWRIQWDHWSSIPDTKDRGIEIISIRYRYTFK